MSYNDYIVKGFNKLLPPVSGYVTRVLKEQFGDSWWNEAVLNKLSDKNKRDLPEYGEESYLISKLDIQRIFILLDVHWNEVFGPRANMKPPELEWNCRTWSKELLDVRNKSAHIGLNDFAQQETARALETMSLLCRSFSSDIASEINNLSEEIRWMGRDVTKREDVASEPISDNVVIATDLGVKPIPRMSTSSSDHSGSVSMDSDRLTGCFEGCIVRKDLTKKIKEGANVPIFVLEYLLGMYCSSDDEDEIQEGLDIVKDKLSRLYIRPDESELVKSKIREAGDGYSIIDKVSVSLNYKKDYYEASFLSLGLKGVPIERDMVVDNPRLLSGGIWCIITFDYSYIGDDKTLNPFKITRLTPIQMPFVDVDDYISSRSNFTKDEWIALMLRSVGIEPNSIDRRTRMLLMGRMMALVENNINICELGPRSTGKSHIFKEISPSSILVSGGQATVASLFYNLSTHMPGLVCNWDVVAFDEVAEIKFKDNDAIAILKDYMASGSFSRGGEHLEGKASMVFVGNVNEKIDTLLLQASLFKPFPEGMNEDTAFLDRFHCYIPGWEIEPFSPKTFTDDYGFICDYFAEIARELRKTQFSNVIDRYFRLDDSLRQRDITAIRKITSAMMKLIYPDGNVDKEGVREILEFAMEMRSRVKEQLKRIQPGEEFEGARFIYYDLETGESNEVLVPECVQLSIKQGVE
ncbi:protease Lon-related BREX system protein BrxL [Methanomethylophilus alvi]|uniref:protease Lon-related BREX system protein BrxL n=1 Tax=Methanomethylophilus alvi TaxID=1291540 RepID=UPI0037DC0D6D